MNMYDLIGYSENDLQHLEVYGNTIEIKQVSMMMAKLLIFLSTMIPVFHLSMKKMQWAEQKIMT